MDRIGADRPGGAIAAGWTDEMPRRATLRRRINWTAVSMIAPAVLALLAIGLFPLLYAVNASFRLYQLTKPYLGHPWVGLDNYRAALQDDLFWASLRRTAVFLVATLPVQVVLGVAVALLLHSTRWRKLSAVTRVLLVLPIATTPTVVGLIGRLTYNRDFGVVNWALGQIGLGPFSWLGQPRPAFFVIALTDTWQWTPFVALVALAGLTAVPEDIVEASRLDTGSGWEIFRHVQLPFLWPGITAILIIRTADMFKLFDMVFIMTRGGPGVSTELVSLYLQRLGFRIFDLGVASAQAILLLVLCIALSRFYLRVFYREIEA
ncbi:MAG TPA: sugar ABC transporter permease [Thermomicrobiales bacterium]